MLVSIFRPDSLNVSVTKTIEGSVKMAWTMESVTGCAQQIHQLVYAIAVNLIEQFQI